MCRMLHVDAFIRREVVRNPGKTVMFLEGGYNCISLAHSFAACLCALLGGPAPSADDVLDASNSAHLAIARTAIALWPYWPNQRNFFAQAMGLVEVDL